MRQFLFTGFNAFGQHNINKNNNSCRTSVLEICTPRDSNEYPMIIAPCWRYTAYAVGQRLFLQGLFDSQPGECLEVEAAVRIKALAACDNHCLVLLQNGELFKLAAKLRAQLVQIKLENPPIAAATKRTIFGDAKRIACGSPGEITHIACGSHINVAISAGNAIYSIPSCLHQFPVRQWRVQQLECGNEHAILLNGNGDVYSWGNGLRGQLGHEALGVQETPRLIDALAGIKITHIAAGGWHSAAISAFGDLYTWGSNCNGQLGMRVLKPGGLLKEPTVYPLPQLHDLPECCEAAQDADADAVCSPLRICAGSRHTLLVRSCGRVWGSGWTIHGQLGKQLEKRTYLDKFEAIYDAPANYDYNVICGPWATLIMLSK
ncbi:GH20910 [Drosophila grimshawi]|uniref:GH20910 n=1 Tax=Drosophila grimshawi TaxID=7222 RepID=B4JRK5_DROGR|nr:GH20910 [Drosophila grimshawi]